MALGVNRYQAALTCAPRLARWLTSNPGPKVLVQGAIMPVPVEAYIAVYERGSYRVVEWPCIKDGYVTAGERRRV